MFSACFSICSHEGYPLVSGHRSFLDAVRPVAREYLDQARTERWGVNWHLPNCFNSIFFFKLMKDFFVNDALNHLHSTLYLNLGCFSVMRMPTGAKATLDRVIEL